MNLISNWPEWNNQFFFLYGPGKCGKTSICKIWKRKSEALFLNERKIDNFFFNKEGLDKIHQNNWIIDDIDLFLKRSKNHEKLLNLIGKRRLLIPMPLPIAQMSARFFEIMPNPLLTRDQLRLLKYDNIASGKYKTNFDIGVPSLRYFDQEVKKYSFMWREGGQFSTDKYVSKQNKEINPN